MQSETAIMIKKSLRLLELYKGSDLVKTYRVVLGYAADGNKSVEGDGRTPEGAFFVFTKNPKSKFCLSLGISYPDKGAAERGLADELISDAEFEAIDEAIDRNEMPPQKTRLGGEIYIHGGGVESDWTEGCVALGNSEMEELFAAVPVGCPVTIVA